MFIIGPASIPYRYRQGLGWKPRGVVDVVGPGVTDLAPGQRVAYASLPIGAYAQARCIPAERVVPIPDSISDQTAAAMMLQGMTVEYLLCRTYPVQAGETVLFHAAAGGVGLIACQWARDAGVTLIGTVGSAEKADLARSHGAAHVINYREENVVERVRDLTGGQGVSVVYDSVGADTWLMSLDCLRPRGMMVSFGNASGPVTDVNLGILAQKGSLYVTRPTLMAYTAKADEMHASAKALIDRVAAGRVVIPINQTYALEDVASAHRDLEARKTTGSTILTV